MRKAIVVSFLLAVGFVYTSQAVVIHWAVDTPQSGTTSAALVYVSTGAPPVFSLGVLALGTEVGARVSGLAVTPSGIGERTTTDAETRTQGSYYVVLFNEAAQYSVSSTSLAYNNGIAITADAMTPAEGFFTPGTFSNWTPIPEPSAAALLCLGAAAALSRRRKRT